MCGICGIFHLQRPNLVSQDSLAAMNRQIGHRGPDDEGFYISGNVGLAMRRLSIIDLATGHQPISNEDGSLWIVYNGEIYNHHELRSRMQERGHQYRTRSDTETIIHLFEEYGPDCIRHLRGMFAFVIWDERRRRLFAVRDRLGIKPFYYWYDGERFLFASEIKALLACPGVNPAVNRKALPEYLAFGYLSGPESMFAGVHKLPPGHRLQLQEGGQPKIEQYWDLAVEPETAARPRAHYVTTYREKLEEAVRSHLMSDVPLGVFLSGGLDSSAVAALTTKIRGERIQTFSVGYAEQAYSELRYAQEVASHIGSEHFEVVLDSNQFFQALPKLIWHEDEPLVWPSSVSLYFVARLARERVTVVLTGEGADETLAGYTRYPWTVWNSRLDGVYRTFVPAGVRRLVREQIFNGPLRADLRRKLEHTFLGRNGEMWSSFYFDNFYSAFSAAEQAKLLLANPDESLSAYDDGLNFWNHSSGDLLRRLLYTDIKTYLVELLMKQDNMSMAASIESRVPFLDHLLVEFAAAIPAKFFTRGLAGKCILKKAVEDVLPKSIIYRKKMGFPTPWSHWLMGPHLDKVEEILLSARTLERGWFRPEAIRQLFAEHRAGVRDNGDRLWRLLNFELWQRVFLDGDPSLVTRDCPPVRAIAGR